MSVEAGQYLVLVPCDAQEQVPPQVRQFGGVTQIDVGLSLGPKNPGYIRIGEPYSALFEAESEAITLIENIKGKYHSAIVAHVALTFQAKRDVEIGEPPRVPEFEIEEEADGD